MRDIRDDLHERLRAVTEELNALTGKVASLQEQKAQLSKLLEAENRRFHAPQESSKQVPLSQALRGVPELVEAFSSTALMILIRRALADGKPYGLQEIVDRVLDQKYYFGDKSPRRSINFRLLAMKKANQVVRVRLPDGRRGWQLK